YRVIERLIDGAALDSRWQKLAALDAATRMLVAIARGKGLRPGSQATKVLEAFVERAWQSTSIALEAIPANFWSVRPATAKDENPQQLLMRGAVLVWVAGRSANRVMTSQLHVIEQEGARLSPELVAALNEKPGNPLRDLFAMLRADGLLAPMVVIAATLM